MFYEKKDCTVQSFGSVDLEFPEHLHDHVEILLVLEGSVVVRIMERSCELKPGDCAVIFPQQIHSYSRPAGSRTRLFIFEDHLTGTYLHSVRRCVPAHPFLSAGEGPEDGRLALDRLYDLSRVEQDIPEAVRETPPSDAERMCSAWIQVFLSQIWSQLAPEKRNSSMGMELTCQVVQYVMEHFQEPLTLELLAQELHTNKYYISHIFSNRIQINFRQYLNLIRLEYAIQLMKTTSAPLTDISLEAGFSSQRSFNRAFTQIMGISPRDYRKSAAAKL